jgi:hypothetical protein
MKSTDLRQLNKEKPADIIQTTKKLADKLAHKLAKSLEQAAHLFHTFAPLGCPY